MPETGVEIVFCCCWGGWNDLGEVVEDPETAVGTFGEDSWEPWKDA